MCGLPNCTGRSMAPSYGYGLFPAKWVNIMEGMRTCIASFLVALSSTPAWAAEPDAKAVEHFEKKIRPVLVERCFKCHGEKEKENGLRLDSRAALLAGGVTGAAVKPGDVEGSLLIKAIRQTDDEFKMPPDAKLPAAVIADFETWVKNGAPFLGANSTIPQPQAAIDYEAGRKFWSFQPVVKPALPAVREPGWAQTPIDRFILARLEAEGLAPAAAADKRTLLRRVTFDLTGLPPTPEEMAAFLADDSPAAYERVVDRLLASPQYGETWGRHWLDVVRYADSKDSRSLNQNVDIQWAWRYRDWVTMAFNRDLPYDRFITSQVAGDLEAAAQGKFDPDGIVATSLLSIGAWEWGESDKRKMITDIVDDQIDVVTRGFLGLTVACARCHDHKFDPISREDYYGLAGIFFSSHVVPEPGNPAAGTPMVSVPLLAPAEMESINRAKGRLAELEILAKKSLDQGKAAAIRTIHGRSAEYLTAVAAYIRRDKADKGITPASLAQEAKLDPAILSRWLAYLGLVQSADLVTAPMNSKLVKVGGNANVNGWGAPQTPDMLVNAGPDPVTLGTFTLPARSVNMHPSPTQWIAAGWKSPISGLVDISGKVKDGDAACGNGFEWRLEASRGGTRRQLASGSVANGQGQSLADGENANSLLGLEVQAGELVSLVIGPKASDYACDTTSIELVIRERGEPRRVWNVTSDVVDDVLAGNPHADSFKNPAVWHFYTLGPASGSPPVPPGSALAAWLELAGKPAATPEELKKLSEELTTIFTTDSAPAKESPNAALHANIATPEGAFWAGYDFAPYLSAETRQEQARLTSDMSAARAVATRPVPLAQGVKEGGVPGSEHAGIRDVKVHIRGRWDRLAEVAPRGFPKVLASSQPKFTAEHSGRLELARWLADPANPLTPRVIVNRVWQHHFGTGLVPTSGNFGRLGEPPTHPELLDYLAAQLIESGWSLKELHRLLVLSATYQQTSTARSKAAQVDPGNRLWGKMNRRRLSAEAIRDSLLAVANDLDGTMGGPAVSNLSSLRRTLYVMTIRSDRSNFAATFDQADASAQVDRRNESTVAPQALFLLNHPLAIRQAESLSRGVLTGGPADIRSKIEWLYSRLYGRLPSDQEIAVGLKFINAGKNDPAAWQAYCQLLFCANEFMYVD